MKKEQKKLFPFELEARKIVIIYIIDNLFPIHSLVFSENIDIYSWPVYSFSALQLKKKNTLFTDYNLILQRKEGGIWKNIKLNSGSSLRSNVELIRYRAEKTGIYRLVVKKHKSSLFENSIDDDLAVSHVIQ
ncbi:hypothetical protein [Mesomycoplasma hyopneumoniae]|uniref:hypothetical protein n=1 Tax=Mesomycoplasma hyopneumoniae TaxID=2099 RepID=UPI001C6912DD|nr:hypothetical protein [Mesomycoplasma hyopneumoniae]